MPLQDRNARVIAAVIVGVLVWGIFHAIGAYRFNHDPRRGLVVLACVLGFLAFWGLLLWQRARRSGTSEKLRRS